MCALMPLKASSSITEPTSVARCAGSSTRNCWSAPRIISITPSATLSCTHSSRSAQQRCPPQRKAQVTTATATSSGSAVLTAAGQGPEREITFALLDIERRRLAEARMSQAQASLQRVIETAPLAIALFDARTMTVQQLNQTAASFFGRPLEGLQGALLEEVAAPAQARASFALSSRWCRRT